jgi:uncharacterized membrane protein YfcA
MGSLAWAGLAATAFAAALLQAASGFGFAVLATPLFLLLVEPARAVQLVIVVTTALSLVVLPGLHRAIAPRLLLRLSLGSLVGLPLGLFAFSYADPTQVRVVVGTAIVAFAALLALSRPRLRGQAAIAARPSLDLAAGAVSGATTALIGMSGPPVLMYLLLAGTSPRTARATLLAFFALAYAATLASHVAAIGVPAATWRAAGLLVPFALVGGVAGRTLGDRLGSEAFAALATTLLGAAGLYTLAAAFLAGGGP